MKVSMAPIFTCVYFLRTCILTCLYFSRVYIFTCLNFDVFIFSMAAIVTCVYILRIGFFPCIFFLSVYIFLCQYFYVGLFLIRLFITYVVSRVVFLQSKNWPFTEFALTSCYLETNNKRLTTWALLCKENARNCVHSICVNMVLKMVWIKLCEEQLNNALWRIGKLLL